MLLLTKILLILHVQQPRCIVNNFPFDMNDLYSIPEQVLQRAVHVLLSNPAQQYTTTTGKRIQILAPGRLNVHEGPDYLDMAMLLGSDVVLGSGEFHRNTSDWKKHNHDSDDRYKSVVLHIVLNHDEESDGSDGYLAQVLVLNEDDVRSALRSINNQPEEQTSLEDIHTYSLLRLLRITSAAKTQLQQHTVEQTFLLSVIDFLKRFEKKRRRPAYPTERLEHLFEQLQSSPHARFVLSVKTGNAQEVMPTLNALIETSISDEGAHLRREIIINALLPVALANAKDDVRVKIFEWYWSVTALLDYGVLKRKFPDVAQTYLWQQQGMLEMLREKNTDTSVHETMKQYGLQQTLHFYKLALEAPEFEERP